MRKRKTKNEKYGFTLLETLIAVAIIVLIATVIIWPFAAFRNVKLLDGAAEDILSLLHEAQTRTLSSDGAAPYGVYFESGKMTLFRGAAFPGAGDPNNKEVLIHNRLAISDITIAGGSSVAFKRLTGATDNTGTVTISLVSDSSRQRVLAISAAGNAGLK